LHASPAPQLVNGAKGPTVAVLNPVAVIVGVPHRTFTLWQVARGLVWSVGVVLAGYELGSHIINVDHDLLPIIALIVAVSLTPIALEVLRGTPGPLSRRHSGRGSQLGKRIAAPRRDGLSVKPVPGTEELVEPCAETVEPTGLACTLAPLGGARRRADAPRRDERGRAPWSGCSWRRR
jgi:hypothetical protein